MNASSSSIQKTESEISTGLKVSSPTDNGATWAVAQNVRATVSSLDTVADSLARGQSIVDVAVSAGAEISDTLNQMKALALEGTDASITGSSRTAIEAQYDALRTQVFRSVSTADFDGINILQSSSVFSFLASADGSQTISVQGQGISDTPYAPGPVVQLRGYSLDTTTYASYCLSDVTASIATVNAMVASLGTTSNNLQTQASLVGKFQDTLTTGVGNLVDADVAKDSAALNAEQTKQQLAAQSLSIANQSPMMLLSLFKR